jgi:hypothetical protein
MLLSAVTTLNSFQTRSNQFDNVHEKHIYFMKSE